MHLLKKPNSILLDRPQRCLQSDHRILTLRTIGGL